jgi:CheY-like chemotaxis protein
MRHTILIVDSDPRTRNLLRASLDRRSFAVVEGPDPVSALTILLWTPVALIVVNPRCSRSGGVNPTAFDLLRWIRVDPAFSNIPVLIFADSPPLPDEEARATHAARICALLADALPNAAAVRGTRQVAREWLQLDRVFRVHSPVRRWNALHRLRARS